MNIKLICSDTKKSLLDLLREEGRYIPAYCGGKGICGKCKVRFLKEAPEPSQKEKEILTEKERKEGWRFACTARVQGELEIEVPLSAEDHMEVETGFCSISNLILDVDESEESISTKDEAGLQGRDFIKNNPNEKIDKFSKDGKEHQMVKFPFDYQNSEYIVAVDIGTTTIAASKIENQTKKVIETVTSINHQRLYGADVIARIEASNLGRGKELQQLIMEDIGKFRDCLKVKDDTPVVISGNTTMQHLLQGYSCETLGRAPYTPVDISLHQYKKMTILPGVSTFVGADIVSGIIACGLHRSDKICILVDVGTNGEMAIGNKDRILVASTAAGSAFEGGNIRCGVAGIPGAIASITIGEDERFTNKDVQPVPETYPLIADERGKMSFETIGNEKPIGICGSGVIELTYELLKNGLIDETGLLNEAYFDSGYPLTEDIVFTVKDVREVQLAKSAIRTGIEILIHEYGVGYEEIDRLYLAGGFGKHMSLEKSIGIGLLPEELDGRITAVGNTSLSGAILFATEEEVRADFVKVAENAKEISLTENRLFPDLYMKHMYFPK